jgi:hypothetical protein
VFTVIKIVIPFLGLVGDFVFGGGVEAGAVSCAVAGKCGEGFGLFAGFVG